MELGSNVGKNHPTLTTFQSIDRLTNKTNTLNCTLELNSSEQSLSFNYNDFPRFT